MDNNADPVAPSLIDETVKKFADYARTCHGNIQELQQRTNFWRNELDRMQTFLSENTAHLVEQEEEIKIKSNRFDG